MVSSFGMIIWKKFENMLKVLPEMNIEKPGFPLEIVLLNLKIVIRDPYSATLWYVLLNKKNVLLTLCGREEKFKAVAEFLKRNKVAASKNAYKLLQQKKYELSAAFFLLGGYLSVILPNSDNL